VVKERRRSREKGILRRGRGREKVEGRVTHNVYCFLLPIGLNQIKIIYSKKLFSLLKYQSKKNFNLINHDLI